MLDVVSAFKLIVCVRIDAVGTGELVGTGESRMSGLFGSWVGLANLAADTEVCGTVLVGETDGNVGDGKSSDGSVVEGVIDAVGAGRREVRGEVSDAVVSCFCRRSLESRRDSER